MISAILLKSVGDLYFRDEDDERRASSDGRGKNADDPASFFRQSAGSGRFRSGSDLRHSIFQCQYSNGHRFCQRRVVESGTGNGADFRSEHRHDHHRPTGGI